MASKRKKLMRRPGETYFLHTLRLTDDYLKALGAITVNWSVLEFKLGIVLGEMLGLDRKLGRLVMQPLAAEKAIELLKQTATYLDQDEKLTDEINRIHQLLEALRQSRRLFVHGVWAADAKGVPSVLKYYGDTSNRILAQPYQPKVDEITATAVAIGRAVAEIDLWWQRARPVLRPSP